MENLFNGLLPSSRNEEDIWQPLRSSTPYSYPSSAFSGPMPWSDPWAPPLTLSPVLPSSPVNSAWANPFASAGSMSSYSYGYTYSPIYAASPDLRAASLMQSVPMSSGITRRAYALGYSVQQVLRMSDAEFCSFMEADGIRYFLANLRETSVLRAELNLKILSCRLSATLATDEQGNRLMQRLIEHSGAYVEDILESIFDDLEELACDRYASRVVQKLLDFVPLEQVSAMVAKLVSNGVSVLADHYGSFVFCHVINHFGADLIAPVVDRLQTPEIAHNVATKKYGSRVVQHLLRRLPELASNSDSGSLATILLDKVVSAIVAKAPVLVSNEFGNFIVSQVIKADNLVEYRNKIINSTICGNILSLSQEKFASHVVEQALQSAEPRVLAVLVTEVLQGYEPDFRDRDAVDILVMNQYGNYVVQSVLDVCIDVLKGKREGNKKWFFALRKKILAAEKIIEQYTSGKKILQMIAPYRFLTGPTQS